MTLGEATVLTADERALLATVADHLIPAAHGMPSAADVLTDGRLRFVFNARPDLVDGVRRSLEAGLAADPAGRVAALAADDPAALGALQLTIVAGYYTDAAVRERIGYPGQIALSIRSWEVPPYVEEGLIDNVLARGPVWRDPATGKRAVATNAPRTWAERFTAPPEGDPDGHVGA
jgi:hypothetical protein